MTATQHTVPSPSLQDLYGADSATRWKPAPVRKTFACRVSLGPFGVSVASPTTGLTIQVRSAACPEYIRTRVALAAGGTVNFTAAELKEFYEASVAAPVASPKAMAPGIWGVRRRR